MPYRRSALSKEGSTTPLVSLIILNYNGEDLIKECIESCLSLSYPEKEIIVVDNASEDDSVSVISKFPEVRLIENKENYGYAEGNNIGVRASMGKYVATLNNDLTLKSDWLNHIVDFLESYDDCGIAGSRQMQYYNPQLVDSLYVYPGPGLLIDKSYYGKRYKDIGAGWVIAANGANAVYRRSMLDKIGLFEESFFAYHEESDLCMRAFLHGWRSVFIPEAVAYHKGSISFNRTLKKLIYLHERNRIWFIYRFYPWVFILQRSFHLIFMELRLIRVFLFKKRAFFSYLRARYHGLRDMKRFRSFRKEYTAKFKRSKNSYLKFYKDKILPLE